MLTSMTSVSRTIRPLCHICRHQVRGNRVYITNHVNQSFPSLIRLQPTVVCPKLGYKTVFSWKSKGECNVTQKEGIDSCEIHGLSTAAPISATERYNSYKGVTFNQSMQSITHSVNRTCKRQVLKLLKYRTLSTDEKAFPEEIQSCYIANPDRNEETDSRSMSKFFHDTDTCTGTIHTNLKPEKWQISSRILSSTLFHRQIGTVGHYLRSCNFHTSVEKNTTQSRVTALRQEPPWRILFFGTDNIAVEMLKKLHENLVKSGSLVESLEVVTGEEKKAVRRFAERAQLKIHEWPIAIETDKYDVGVLVSFGHLIPDDVIHMFPYGILNMHPSLLPRWRGASPIIHTILNADDVTGVSIMEIRPKHFDIGPLLLQRKCLVPHRCTSHQLADILAPFGANMMLECLKDLLTMERLEHEQDRKGITYAHKLKHKDANIDWEMNTPEEIDCQYRAITEFMHLKTELDGHTVKLLDVVDPVLLKDVEKRYIRGYKGKIIDSEPGTVAYHTLQKCIVVKCKGGLIGFRSVVLRQTLTASDFFNGYINKNSYTQFKSLENDLNKYVREERLPMTSQA